MLRRVCLTTLSLLALGSVARSDEVRRNELPMSVVGRWAPSADQCGSRSAMSVAPHGIRGADGRCRAGWVVETPGIGGPNFSVHAACTRRGQPTRVVNTILRPEGDRLLAGASFEALVPYVRCP